MSDSIFIKGGTVITVDDDDRVLEADLLIRGSKIERIVSRDDDNPPALDETGEIIDATGCAVLPGFVQTHIHLCQTLMRGYADDLALLDWLRKRVWPMEAAHTPESLYASARLGIAEMMRGGTTTALTMETVRHTDAVFRAIAESGFRAVVGKCLMDGGEGVPKTLIEDTRAAIDESLALFAAWQGKAEGRIRCAFAPRFALSCTRELLENIAELARERQAIIHTHASESRDEIALVRAETGRDNIEYLNALGLTGARTVLAHCVWATDAEIGLLTETKTNVSHCPSSNLKLGSGIARVAEMRERGVNVSLGADGAPCNNRLDMLTEMRTAALLQKVRQGPETLPAQAALRMATIDGARALGLGDEIGSIEEGKRADLIIFSLDRLHLTPHPDVVSTIVYAAERADIQAVLLDGRLVVREGQFTTLDEGEIKAKAHEQSRQLAARCELKL
ncbi:MAG TPA: 5'-deoxyadenosine deaminase [Blastocatellia bacterium]|nr:5'-deoxyadenosine deaminase [Blastocatellia bacterium]